MDTSNNTNQKYFIFSREQLDTRTNAEKLIGKKYVPGDVIVQGKKHAFTEISDKPETRYKDGIVVAKGILDDMRYTLPKTY